MNYLEHIFPNGTVLQTPDELLIIEDYNFISKDSHYKIKFGRTYNGAFCIDVINKNGKPTQGMYLLLETFLNLKYVECSIDKYNNLRTFF